MQRVVTALGSASAFIQRTMHGARWIFAASLSALALVVVASAAPAPASMGRSCTRWRLVASPMPPNAEYNVLEGVDTRSSTDAWAVGWYENHDYANQYTYAEHWDGKAWVAVPTPNAPPPSKNLPFDRLEDVAVLGSADVWAVGFDNSGPDDLNEPLIEHWDGQTWSIVDVGARAIGTLYAVGGTSSKDVWAVGQRLIRTGVRHAIVFHWDGTSWHEVPVPRLALNGGGLYGLDVRGRNDAWAAGAREWGERPLALHWNGRRWRSVRFPRSIRGELHDIAMPTRTSGWAVGTQGSPLAVRWNGWRWRVVRAPRKYRESVDQLEAVGVLPGGRAWAVGYGTPGGDFNQMIVQRWNGRRWRNTHFQNLKPGWLTDLSRLTPRDGWAVGARFYSTGSGGYAPLTEHFGPC